jgi:hypothetical protein
VHEQGYAKLQSKRVIYVEGNVDRAIGGSYFSLLFLTTAIDRQFRPPWWCWRRTIRFARAFMNAALARLLRKRYARLVHPGSQRACQSRGVECLDGVLGQYSIRGFAEM